MRIAFLGDGSLPHIRRWAGYFHRRGHQVLLLSFEDTSGCPFPCHQLSKSLPTQLAGYLAALPLLKKKLKTFRPELVNALYAGGYGLLGALCGHRPLIISALGSDLLVDYPSSILHRKQIEYALRNADLVTADADILVDAARAAGVSADRILKIYFGIDENIFHPPPGPRDPGGPAQIISTRNLYALYNLDLLIDAAPLILSGGKAHFIICGEGPERGRLQKKVSSMKLTDRFSFQGRLGEEEIAGQLQRASVYVSTSFSDSTSVSLLEAMACGVPPVVTDSGANREWIDPEKNGLLVPVDSPSRLAEAVRRIIAEPALAEKIRENNYQVIRERGLWKSNLERAEERFIRLVE
ncbi:MAG: glycosyltransferase [Candidatus Krumholzibacteriota bacterium]|nr:glycosyltransferase [Candidatus Krumholzibacteriota bacterium]